MKYEVVTGNISQKKSLKSKLIDSEGPPQNR